MRMKQEREGFGTAQYILFFSFTLAAAVLCVCVGSVSVSVRDTFEAVADAIKGDAGAGAASSIIVAVRLPRVICVALVGAALSLCGAAMQGLLRNPLADGSTLGVSSGASLGAVLAIALGFRLPWLASAGTMLMAISFAFASLVIILTLAYRLDCTLSTNTIILIGVVFSMFASSLTSIVISFAGSHVKTITFWSMGSLAGSSYADALILLGSLALFAPVLLCLARELNAFSVGEDNARSIGVNVRRVKLTVLIAASVLIGVSVSISGTIGFVGLVVPHMTRLIVGPNHKKLLPASMFSGASFLMLADLAARTVISPIELPIGVVTSLVGSLAFVYILYISRRRV